MFVKRKFDVAAIAMLALGLVAYAAFQPRLHLRPEMPAEFFDASGPRSAKKVADQKVAEAYWRCAVGQIQWEYGYAHRLPDNAPPDFLVTTSQVGAAANDSKQREHYWQKLCAVWSLPSVWKTDYGLDLTSMRRSFQSAGDWLQYQMWRLTGTP